MCLRAIALDFVAMATKQLEIVQAIGPAFRLRDDMIDFVELEWEIHTTAAAASFLLSKERMFVGCVGRELVNV